MVNKKAALLGASRGLGAETDKLLLRLGHQTLVISRKTLNGWSCDFSDEKQWDGLVEKLKDYNPDQIIYFAGGGPYGNFGGKNWQDHKWAFRVTFECPAFLLHKWCQNQMGLALQQMTFIGSQIAETKPDPNAASYCAAKHALRGLIDSVKIENPQKKLHLFSPGYMDTAMLPANAWPRQNPGQVRPPAQVSEELVQIIESK